MLRSLCRALLTITVLFICGCGKHPHGKSNQDDVFYSINKPVLQFNTFLDRCIFEPIAVFYLYRTPPQFQTGFRNFLHNLSEPAIAFNQACQGRWQHAAASLTRFLHNTFWGLGGVFDVAAKHNLPKRITSFGDTLKQWNAPPGQYIILPILGSYHIRDACGAFLDWFLNPGSLLTYRPLWVVGGQSLAERADYVPTLRQIYSTSENFDALYDEFRNIAAQRAGVGLSDDLENDIF